MVSLSHPSPFALDTVTNQFLDEFPIHCQFRTGAIGQSQMHSHRGYELYFCTEGQGKLLVGDRVYALEPGTFTIIKPFVLHWPRVSGTKPLHRFVLSIHERFVQSWFERLPVSDGGVRSFLLESDSSSLHKKVSAEQITFFHSMLAQISQEAAGRQIHYEAAALHLLAGLLIVLDREEEPAMDHTKTNLTPLHLAERILHYLSEHYADRIESSRLHEHFNVSRSHMYDHFKQWTGLSINRYLILYRIDQAKRLLMDSPLSVTEIAYTVGFNDLSHFFHTFKSEEGITPNLFRKK
ncbi:AraC family transcriptional regulator [Paenibacillus planticolens]|uniref:Helix-turn-helix domain-containing protein n=1 Tax=Paenibacillus planticolens TaxID=2654976 RepID=A0ABX1ZVE3_9BACL|nr:AraC family transcriptional regulator [Paenibacillus planticolens]NOV04015.1 helix-turn-helix domain-containing protein [Paenibacillus planticolens]